MSILFDSIWDDIVVCSDNANLDGGNKLAIAIRVKIANFAGPGGIGSFWLAKWKYQTQGSWMIGSDNTGEIIFFIADALTDAGENRAITTDANLSTGVWGTIFFNYDGSQATNDDKISIYVGDGSKRAQGFGTGTIPATLQNSTAPFTVGDMDITGTLSRATNGQLVEAAVWKGINLTAVERAILANSHAKHMPLQIRPSNLSIYLPMDDGADGTSADGDTVKDLSGSGNHGIGDDGAGAGLTWKAEEQLSYPAGPIYIPGAAEGIAPFRRRIEGHA